MDDDEDASIYIIRETREKKFGCFMINDSSGWPWTCNALKDIHDSIPKAVRKYNSSTDI